MGQLSFTYEDGTVALDSVEFSLEYGEKVAVVGPNGAGKSTLLHLIAGFRMPFAGSVRVVGKALTHANADDIWREIGLLFQDPDDQVFMSTVEEDVAFGPRNLDLEDVDNRVERAMRISGVEHLAKRNPQRLSFGMKKRVAIAGLMAMEPKVLLLDEPTSGLDPRSRSEFVRLLKGMDRTMLIATHDLDAAAEIVDRVVVLNKQVIMTGTVQELVMKMDVLSSVGLKMPPIPRLFEILESMGHPVDAFPVSMDQAVAELTKLIDRERRQARTSIQEPAHGRNVEGRSDGHEGMVRRGTDDQTLALSR